MSSSKKKRHYRQEKEEQEAEERGIALGLVGTEPSEVKEDPVEEVTTQVVEVEEPLTEEELELGKQVLEELEDEDGEEEVRDEEEEEIEDDEEEKEMSLLKSIWNFLKEKLGGSKQEKADTGVKPFVILKDKTGNYRYVAIVSNNFRDRDGDIITEKAHKEFMEYLDANPTDAPELWIWHTPGTAHKSRADFWTFDNGFVIFSGTMTEEEAMRAEKAASLNGLGMSHGMNIYKNDIVLERDPQKKLINKYRTFEISYLPLERAANPWTAWSVIKKEVEQMDESKKKFLEETLGAEFVAELESNTDKAKQVLDALSVESKEVSEAPQSHPAETPAIEDITKAVAQQFGMEQLSEVIAGLKQSVEELKADAENKQKVIEQLSKSQDEKIAEQIQTTPFQMYAWLEKSQSRSDQTIADPKNEEDAKLLEQKPKLTWLTDVYNQ